MAKRHAHLIRYVGGNSKNVSRRVFMICFMAVMTNSSSLGVTCALSDAIKSYSVVTIRPDTGVSVLAAG